MTRRLVVVTAAVSVVLIAAFWFAAWRPTSHQLAAAHKRLSDAQSLQVQLRSQVSELRSEQKNVSSYESELKALQAAVPANASLDTIIDQLTAAAAASGVTLPAVDPSQAANPTASPQKGQKYTVSSLALDITAQGTYPELLKFINLLDSAPRLFVVDNLAMTSGAGAQGISANLSIRAFYSSPNAGSAS